VIDINGIEREGDAGKAQDPLCSEELIAGQTPEKCRGLSWVPFDAERIP